VKPTNNITLLVFAASVALACFIPVTYGQAIPHDVNPSPLDHARRNQRKEHSAAVEHQSGGIREVIADEYKKRYWEWKSEFLSTETGRRQWDFYARHERLILTITVSQDLQNGARTNQYKWSESGQLISATITLGSQIDKGFPDPSYYPVINGLKMSQPVNGKILAAAKIAHEFGHVSRTASAKVTLYQLRHDLIPVYNSIFKGNGFNARDPRLIALADLMGGTPVELYEDGEYWGEVNAMDYLRERIAEERFQRPLIGRIRQNVSRYAVSCKKRYRDLLTRTALSSLPRWSE
jgi:hypothetical protein